MHLDCAFVIPARDVEICHCDLKYAAVQVADFIFLVTPGIFKRLVRLVVFAAVEERDSVPGARGKIT